MENITYITSPKWEIKDMTRQEQMLEDTRNELAATRRELRRTKERERRMRWVLGIEKGPAFLDKIEKKDLQEY